MKAHLLYRDRDLRIRAKRSQKEQSLVEDLGLEAVFGAMAQGDESVHATCERVLLSSLADPEQIRYRQDILDDCLREREAVRELYDLAVEAANAERNGRFWLLASDSPNSVLHRSIGVLGLLLEHMAHLHQMATERRRHFRSEGFTAFFEMILAELDDEYLEEVRGHLRRLAFKRGVLTSARLSDGNKGSRHVLRRPNPPPPGVRGRVTSLTHRSGYSFRIPDRDEAGTRALEELRSRGINEVANAAAQAADHVLSFFAMLRLELGFYMGALNLHSELAGRQCPTCRPRVETSDGCTLSAGGLYDAVLALRLREAPVGNDLRADGRRLVVITGANQGGKSTFLRSVGLAQIMMQAGLFVAAQSFAADVRDQVLTHFRREEDATMSSGKLDEELARMRAIVETATPASIVLCNESFAATNELEGSRIAFEIVRGLLDSGVKVLYVTHMYELAGGLHDTEHARATFLRAERRADGRRTFHIREGDPLRTSYAADLYKRMFGEQRSLNASATS